MTQLWRLKEAKYIFVPRTGLPINRELIKQKKVANLQMLHIVRSKKHTTRIGAYVYNRIYRLKHFYNIFKKIRNLTVIKSYVIYQYIFEIGKTQSSLWRLMTE